MKDSNNYHWEIQSKTAVLDLKLRDVWAYRDLLWLMVRRDFVAVYKQTILGPLWFIIQPLFTIVIYTVVFGKIAGISTEGLPRPVFYMAGITVWNYFADCLMKSSGVFRDNAGVFGKVYFPRLVVPFSAVISNMVRFAIQMLLFIGFIFYYYLNGMALHVNVYALLFPFLVLLIALLGMGSGMIISALTTKYRDLSFLVSFSMQLLMYATTVIYPLSAAPDNYKWVIMINPVTAIIETFRYGFLGSGSFSWALLAYASAFTFIILFVGIVVFTKVEKNFIDTV